MGSDASETEHPDAPGGVSVRFAVFGGVRVSRGAAEVEITQPKQRAILGLLQCTPGEPVFISEIISTLWPGEPAASVTNQIHRHIGALRRTFEPGLPRRHPGRYLLAAGTGYRLVAGPGNCDVLRFRGLVREARQLADAGSRTEARRSYLTALEVAPAPPGDDRMWDLPAFVALEDERVRAIIAAVEHCETTDDYAAVLPVLRAAASHHRLNEALHARLITTLARTGRTAEALEVYGHIRAELRGELGASPSCDLEAAHIQTLRSDSPTSPPPEPGTAVAAVTPPAQLPSPPATFAGRRDILATLVEHWKEQPQVLVITGMAGVGKTTLALRLATALADQNPEGQLYLNLRGFDATAAPTEPLDALRDLLQALGVHSRSLPESVDARSGLLRSLLSERRVLVVLDNARDYRQVEPLLPGPGASRVIITSRHQMPTLHAFHQAHAVQLDPFDDNEAVEFLSQRLSAAQISDSGDAMVRLGRACGGLPLALAIIAARASATPAFPLDLLVREFAQDQTLRLAHLTAGADELDLSTVFSWSHRGLSKDAAHTFAVLSAHPGPEISLRAAVSISGLDPRRTREVLLELSLASVLRESRPNRFVFHDLIRQYALTLLAERSAEASARVVSHYVRSVREAVLTFGRPALAPVDDSMPGIVPETFASSGEATHWYTSERQVLHNVCRLAMDLGDHRSALLLMLDWRPMSQGVDARHDMLPFAELALEAADHVDEDSLRAECFRDVATTFARTGQRERARHYFDLASQTFEHSGNRAGQANVYRNMAHTLTMEPKERIELLHAAVAIARELGDRPILATMLHGLALALEWEDRHEEELAALAECAAIIADLPGLSYLEPYMLSARAKALAGSGRLEESVREARRALELTRHAGEIVNELALLLSLGDALTALGRTPEAAEIWRRFLALATHPELVENTLTDDDADGATIIDRVRATLAALDARSGQ